jgi:hypothetical protein
MPLAQVETQDFQTFPAATNRQTRTAETLRQQNDSNCAADAAPCLEVKVPHKDSALNQNFSRPLKFKSEQGIEPG